MPGQGEQHEPAATSVNPFEEVKPHVNVYTAQEIATLSSRLEKQLGPEYISSRPGAGGGKVHYLSADKCINLANEVFGFNGWSSGIQNIQIDFVDESQSTGKISLGLSVIVRVTLRDGTFHEDVGYGHIENCKGKAAAFEKAKKEGTTDGLKRALRNFGNLLGNCIYDKDYVAKVTKLRIAPTKWDPDNLHRHPDFAPTKPFIGDGEDEFGSDDFDEVDFSVPQGDHPDEVSVGPGGPSKHFQRRNSLPNKQHPPPLRAPNQYPMQGTRSPPRRNHSRGPQKAPQTPMNPGVSCLKPSVNTSGLPANHASTVRPSDLPLPQQADWRSTAQQLPPPKLPQNAQSSTNAPQAEPAGLESSSISDHETPVGFFTARAAESIQGGSGKPIKASPFNPHLESPSIRKTSGVDHSKTKPIVREAVASAASPAASRPNFVNPQTDKTRRLGMPGGGASPLQNRGSYKPPAMKRPAEADGTRSALGDVTASSINVGCDDGGDVKRQRVSAEAQRVDGNGSMLNA